MALPTSLQTIVIDRTTPRSDAEPLAEDQPKRNKATLPCVETAHSFGYQ
jgi:hypothetical protein